MASATMSTALT